MYDGLKKAEQEKLKTVTISSEDTMAKKALLDKPASSKEMTLRDALVTPEKFTDEGTGIDGENNSD